MPELPEVQTFINTIYNKVINRKIQEIGVLEHKIIKNIKPNLFIKNIVGRSIKDIQRKGKNIIFIFDNESVLLVHLRMEGKLFVMPTPNSRFVRLWFKFKDNYLVYDDSRKFGTFHWYKSINDLNQDPSFAKVGDDLLQKNFNIPVAFSKINCSAPIKSLLLDQTIMAGIGNIYADEILFACKIHPQTKGKDINIKQFKMIINEAKKIFQQAIIHHGTTVSTYNYDGEHAGGFTKYLKVHTRFNCPCPRCKTMIKKIRINGRGTYFCPKCQIKK